MSRGLHSELCHSVLVTKVMLCRMMNDIDFLQAGCLSIPQRTVSVYATEGNQNADLTLGNHSLHLIRSTNRLRGKYADYNVHKFRLHEVLWGVFISHRISPGPD